VRKTLVMIQKLADAEEEEEEEEEEGEDCDEYEEDYEEDTDDLTEEERQARKEKARKEKADKYKTFWKEFGKNIKLGIIEDASNRNKLAELARWYSTHNTNELTSLDAYIERMKDNQDAIYYIGGEDKDTLLKAPAIQALVRKGYEILLLDDPIDEFCMQHLTEYEKKKIVNVAKETFKMPSDGDLEKKRLKKIKQLYKPLTDWWRQTLSEYIESVVISQRLVDDPCVIVAAENGYSAYMEKISRAQAYASSDKQHPFMNSKRVLEINPSHPVVKELLERVKEGPDTETTELATVLYETALLNSGYSLHDTHGFSKRFFKLFNGALGIPKDAKVEEVEVDLDEDEEPKAAEKTRNDEVEEEVEEDPEETTPRGDDDL